MDVHLLVAVLQRMLDVLDSLDELIEGKVAIVLKVEMLHLPVRIAEDELSDEVVFVRILADVPNKVRSGADMLGKLGDVATLREVDVVDAGDDFGDC